VTTPPKALRPAPPRGQTEGARFGHDAGPLMGREIRNLRKVRGMTLAQLAGASGLSVSFISQIERGLSTPSVKALHDIAQVLGVNISWFFEGPQLAPIEERDFIVRADRRRRLTFSSGIADYLLSPSLSGQLELLKSTFEPGASSGDEPYTHKGEEAGIVVSGSLELWIGKQRHLLRPGDSFGFYSSTPHRYRNPGDIETVVIWAITPPSY